MKIANILSAKPNAKIFSISPDETLEGAARMLSNLRIGSLVVGDEKNELHGILSERDIVREVGKRGAEALQDKVSSVMTAKVKSVAPSATSHEALSIMSEGRFRHLPVIEEGKLVGMISIGDVVSARLKEIEQENSALNDMISGNTF